MKGTVIEMKLISIREGLMERSRGGWWLERLESCKIGRGWGGGGELRDQKEKAMGTHSHV